jgi:hypothetical protein
MKMMGKAENQKKSRHNLKSYYIMPQMISRGKELLRICPNNSQRIEYSTNDGRSWIVRFSGNSSTGNFSDLMDNGKEILGTTSKGLYYSTNEGRSWIMRHH